MALRIFTEPQQGASYDQLLTYARTAEAAGFSAFFRSASQYKNQISVVDGKKAGTDINLYKLFLEQCHNLLREGGRCGIIIPSGVYTDLGAKQLREMLFGACEVDTLFGLSNEKFIFESVHHAFKLCILSFSKGGRTQAFRAAFRVNPRALDTGENFADDFLARRGVRLRAQFFQARYQFAVDEIEKRAECAIL